MPTLNPRTNVTLSPSLDLLVVRLAGLQRVSKAQVLRELLEAAEPALQRAVLLMEAASKATVNVREGLAQSLTNAQDQAEREYSVRMRALDGFAFDLVDRAQSIQGRRPGRDARSAPRPAGVPGAGRGGPNPPPSNRGVKSVKRGPLRGRK